MKLRGFFVQPELPRWVGLDLGFRRYLRCRQFFQVLSCQAQIGDKVVAADSPRSLS